MASNSLRSLLYMYSLLRRTTMCGQCCFRHASSSTSKHRTMRSWQITSYGGNESLCLSDSTRVPVIRCPDDILVKVHAASVNPIDLKLMEGYGASLLYPIRKVQGLLKGGSEFPLIPGRDFSGTVVSTGQGSTARRFQPGDEVWGAVLPVRPQGCMAEYVLVPSVGISKKSSSISHLDACSVAYVGLTVWSALCCTAGLSPTNTAKKRILILGGSGGIGTFAIQLVKAWGGDVTTTCGADSASLVADLGADVVLDYRNPDVEKTLTDLKGFDVILDTTGDRPECYTKLLTGRGGSAYVTISTPLMGNSDRHRLLPGLVCSALTFGPLMIKGWFSGQNYYWAVVQNSSKALTMITDLVSSRQIKPVIDQTFTFDDIPAAYKKLSKGPNRGKTVIDIYSNTPSSSWTGRDKSVGPVLWSHVRH